MKITVQTTTKVTQAKEVLIGIPSFTKVTNDYYAVLATDKVVKLWYGESTNATLISESSRIEDAYQEGHEIIERDEFFNVYRKIVDNVANGFDSAFEATYTNDSTEESICEHSAKMEEA